MALFGLTACSDTTGSETYSTISINARDYTVRTRTVTRTDGSNYLTSAVRVGGHWRPCIVDSPGDCEKTALQGRDFPD